MWKIVTWSRAEGRGELESDHHGRLGFDAGVADVDDFIVGEDVWAEIDTGVHPPRVTRVWPEDARYRGPNAPSRAAAALAPNLSEAIEQALGRTPAPASTWMKIESIAEGAAVFVLASDWDTIDAILRVEELVYLAVPATTLFYKLRLATDTERNHVHNNLIDVDEDTAVLVHCRPDGVDLIVGRGITTESRSR